MVTTDRESHTSQGAPLVRSHGDEARYRDHRDSYRAMAASLGFEGHLSWAEAMP
jgi:adenylate cyclase